MTFEELEKKIKTLSPDEIKDSRIYREIVVSGEELERNFYDLSILLAERAKELHAKDESITPEWVETELDRIGKEEERFLLGFEPFSPFVGSVSYVSCQPAGDRGFPIDALPPILRRYVEAVAENIQVSPDMAAVAALGIASICAQGKFFIKAKEGWTLPLNLYIAIIAKPSERKSPMLDAMTRPIYEYERIENERRKPAVDEYRTKHKLLEKELESLTKAATSAGNSKNRVSYDRVIAKKKELSELEENPVNMLRLIADDVTTEAIALLLSRNEERLSIVSSEGGIFAIAAGKYGKDKGANIDVLLKAYSGEPVAVDRIMRDAIRLNHPLLTILLTIQPQVANEVLENTEFRGRGFIARFLFSAPNSIISKRAYRTRPIPLSVENEYNNLLQLLLDLPSGNRIITLSEEADQESELFHYLLEPRLVDDLEPIEDWAGKYHGQVMRIAGLLHVCAFKDKAANFPLEREIMNAAERIGEYFLAQAKAIYQGAGLAESQIVKDAKYILKRLDESGKNPITKRDLQRLCQKTGLDTMEKIEPVLDLLAEHGYIRIEDATPISGKGRKPSKLIFRNLLSM